MRNLIFLFQAFLVWSATRLALKTNVGNDIQARTMGGDVVGDTGTSTAVGTTTMTDTGKAWTVNAWTGHIVTTGSVYGVVVSNTSTILTIDKWNTPSNPGGAAASNPSTGVYVIIPGNGPAWWMALSTSVASPAAGDTTLTSEITTAGGGLIRAVATYAHTTSAANYTLTKTFTANGTDSLPAVVGKIGVFQYSTGGSALFQTLVSPTATLSASGDALTVTETVSL